MNGIPTHTNPIQAIVEFLDKSRSSQSRTHTTSSAPSPALAPATMAFSTLSHQIVDLVHSDAADPNALFYANARSESELSVLAKGLLPFLHSRRTTLVKLLDDSTSGMVQASEKTKAFWELKRIAIDNFIQVFQDADKSAAELSEESRQKREAYLQSANAGWNGLKDVLNTLHQDIIGPYALGMCRQ